MSRSNPRIPLTPIEGTPVVSETPANTNPEVTPEAPESPSDSPEPEYESLIPPVDTTLPELPAETPETEENSPETTEPETPEIEPGETPEEVATFEMVPYNTAAIHPEPGVIVLCELDGEKDPKDRSFVKGQWDDHEKCFFTTANYFYEKLNVNRWLELK